MWLPVWVVTSSTAFPMADVAKAAQPRWRCRDNCVSHRTSTAHLDAGYMFKVRMAFRIHELEGKSRAFRGAKLVRWEWGLAEKTPLCRFNVWILKRPPSLDLKVIWSRFVAQTTLNERMPQWIRVECDLQCDENRSTRPDDMYAERFVIMI